MCTLGCLIDLLTTSDGEGWGGLCGCVGGRFWGGGGKEGTEFIMCTLGRLIDLLTTSNSEARCRCGWLGGCVGGCRSAMWGREARGVHTRLHD